jgi:hypothetical protein
MEIDCLLLMIMICTVSLIAVLGIGIELIRKDIAEIFFFSLVGLWASKSEENLSENLSTSSEHGSLGLYGFQLCLRLRYLVYRFSNSDQLMICQRAARCAARRF